MSVAKLTWQNPRDKLDVSLCTEFRFSWLYSAINFKLICDLRETKPPKTNDKSKLEASEKMSASGMTD